MSRVREDVMGWSAGYLGSFILVGLLGSFHFMYFYCCWQLEVRQVASHKTIFLCMDRPSWLRLWEKTEFEASAWVLHRISAVRTSSCMTLSGIINCTASLVLEQRRVSLLSDTRHLVMSQAWLTVAPHETTDGRNLISLPNNGVLTMVQHQKYYGGIVIIIYHFSGGHCDDLWSFRKQILN